MIFHRQPLAEPVEDGALNVGLEGARAPEFAQKGLGVVGAVDRDQGRGQSHGALAGGGMVIAKPVDHLLRRQAGSLQRLFRQRLAARGSRPAGQITARLIQFEEAHLFAGRIGHGPDREIAGDGIAELRQGG